MGNPNIWDDIRSLMHVAVNAIDLLRSVLLWLSLFLIPVFLGGCLLRKLFPPSDYSARDVPEGSPQDNSLHRWLDYKASVVVSRRPRTRKRRHRHLPHPRKPRASVFA